MNNLLLTLAMAALGQLAPFAGGPIPGSGSGPGLSGAGLPPGLGFGPAPGAGAGYPLTPGVPYGSGGYRTSPYGGGILRQPRPGSGPVVILPGAMPGSGYGGFPAGGRVNGGGLGGYGRRPLAGAPQPAAPGTIQAQPPASEAEAFGLAPYR